MLLSGFFSAKGVPSPLYPLNGKSFCQKKNLSGNWGEPPPPPPNRKPFFQKNLKGKGGDTPPPLNGKSTKLFQKYFFMKGLKMTFLY